MLLTLTAALAIQGDLARAVPAYRVSDIRDSYAVTRVLDAEPDGRLLVWCNGRGGWWVYNKTLTPLDFGRDNMNPPERILCFVNAGRLDCLTDSQYGQLARKPRLSYPNNQYMLICADPISSPDSSTVLSLAHVPDSRDDRYGVSEVNMGARGTAPNVTHELPTATGLEWSALWARRTGPHRYLMALTSGKRDQSRRINFYVFSKEALTLATSSETPPGLRRLSGRSIPVGSWPTGSLDITSGLVGNTRSYDLVRSRAFETPVALKERALTYFPLGGKIFVEWRQDETTELGLLNGKRLAIIGHYAFLGRDSDSNYVVVRAMDSKKLYLLTRGP